MKYNIGFLSFFSPAAQVTSLPKYENNANCKAVPGSSNWPSSTQWATLNHTLNGALLSPLPPAAVCDPTRLSIYNSTECHRIGSQWFDSAFHAKDPVSVDWPNWQKDACLPTDIFNETEKCSFNVFPRYVVNATSAKQVAEAIKFAQTHNVRVSVKGTGHDFLGRKVYFFGAFNLDSQHPWDLPTQLLRPYELCPMQSRKAMTIAAGHRMGEVYQIASIESLTVVAGADANVGIGGYLTGGGHSPISAKYGLAVDQVLEMQVVTPSGNIITASKHQNQDLFWAMNGVSGGATFGILINVTIRTFPPILLTIFTLEFNSTQAEASQNNNTNWYSGLASFFSCIPELSEAGLMGYFWSYPSSYGQNSYTPAANAPSGPKTMTFTFAGWVIDESLAIVENVLKPVVGRLNTTHGIETRVTIMGKAPLHVISATPGSVGTNVRLTSRLWDKKALTNGTDLVKTLRVFENDGLQGLLVSGPGVRKESSNDTISVSPAWRKAYLHLISGKSFPFSNTTAEQSSASYVTNHLGGALRARAPEMGCYLNEADVDEPNYQHAFWGYHYPRLLKIKHELDPNGVFWCSTCVGGEEWALKADGRLCKAL